MYMMINRLCRLPAIFYFIRESPQPPKKMKNTMNTLWWSYAKKHLNHQTMATLLLLPLLCRLLVLIKSYWLFFKFAALFFFKKKNCLSEDQERESVNFYFSIAKIWFWWPFAIWVALNLLIFSNDGFHNEMRLNR